MNENRPMCVLCLGFPVSVVSVFQLRITQSALVKVLNMIVGITAPEEEEQAGDSFFGRVLPVKTWIYSTRCIKSVVIIW